jgi:hypothetical protein
MRRLAAGVSAALALAVPLSGTAGAQSVLNPSAPCPPGVNTAAAPFGDRGSIVPAHQLNVDCAFALDIVEGSNGRYLPDVDVTREQMASMIARALLAAGYTLPAPTDQGFRDIGSSAHRDNINRLAAIGVVEGETASRYNPGAPVRRDQMASFLVRAAGFAFGDTMLTAEGTGQFRDVTGGPHRANVEAAFELFGLALGRAPGQYDAPSGTERDEMATFVVRLVDVTLRNP